MPPCHCKNRLPAKNSTDALLEDIGAIFCGQLSCRGKIHLIEVFSQLDVDCTQNLCYNRFGREKNADQVYFSQFQVLSR